MSTCPGCGKPINATSDPNPKRAARARPGDITVTVCCGTILRFDWQLRLHAMTPAEIEALPKRVALELLEQRERWVALHGERTKPGIVVPAAIKP